MGQPFEDLLVFPAGLSGLLVEVDRWCPVGLQRCLEIGEQGLLSGVGGLERPRPGYLVQAESGRLGHLCVAGDAVPVAPVLGDREGNSLARCLGEDALLQFRPHPGVGAKDRWRTSEHADQLVDRPATDLNALQDRGALVRRRQFVVNVETADFCLDRHVCLASCRVSLFASLEPV